MHRRQTLASTTTLCGIALHSGRKSKVKLIPAQPHTGIVFVRTDKGNVRVPANLDHVGPSFYATLIEKDGVQVRTVEHLLAALYALQVDDLVVEIDGIEPPILDGSAQPFVDAILEAGRREHDVPREYITLVRPVVFSTDDKRIAAYPCREYRVTYAIDFDHPLLGYQELSVSVWNERDFIDKLAPARTFTFESEVEALRKKGLALGGSLDNAVVLGPERLLNDGLRFPDEFVRHKILDLTGDLALLGKPLRAHVVAYRAGHDLHASLVRGIWSARDSWYVGPWTEGAAGLEAAAGL